jgi:hypothetical protein
MSVEVMVLMEDVLDAAQWTSDVTIPVERWRPSKTGLHFEPKVAT